MAKIQSLKSGLIYRNPKPHVRSIHAYFPSVVSLNGGEMLATFVLGEAFESANCHTHLARSTDGGETWTFEGEIYGGTPDRLTSDACRITALGDGEVVAFLIRADRSRVEEGLTNPANVGFVETELMLMRSADGGRIWSGPDAFEPPLVGPSFEMCSPIVPLKDGRWLLPTGTWRGWDGACPNGMKMVAFVSYDQGQTWPEYVDVMVNSAGAVIYWESKIIELPDGRLLAVAWAYNEKEARDLPNHYAISSDGGNTFSPPMSTGLQGQTMTSILLDSGKILTVYRRMDASGLWANLSRLDGDTWINEDATPLWGAGATGLVATGANMQENFSVLRFGAPCLVNLPDGDLFVAFWCVEDCVSNIRWFRLRIN